MKIINCNNCGIEIEIKNGNQKYCVQCRNERDIKCRKTFKQTIEYKKKDKEYRIKHNEEIIKYQKEYCVKNREKRSKYMKEYNSRPEIKLRNNNYRKQRRKDDKEYNLKRRIGCQFRNTLKRYTKEGKIKTTNKYGIDFKKIIEHLKPFPKDIKKYHVDHIKPISSFKLVNPDGSMNEEEIKKAFAPENHQWLLAKDNLKKWKNEVVR